ncbi:MAG: hypothetical protein AB7Q29_10330 [Vicinamibacterales bacterium]
MTRARLHLTAALLALLPSLAHAQPTCSIQPTKAFRGELIRLKLPDTSLATTARVTLRPTRAVAENAAEPTPARAEYGQQSPDLTVTAGTTSFAVDAEAPLGRYTVAVELDGQPGLTCGTLQVALPDNWKLVLGEFNPRGTFDVSTQKVMRETGPVDAGTISLSLRGSGFLVDVPSDNRIYINGARQPVVWSGCPPPPPPGDAPPAAVITYGAVLNSEQIDLCQVEVPGRRRVVSVEVSQEGVARTAVRYFRLYWWDRKIVGTFAGLVALGLAGVVLFFAYRLKTQSGSQSLSYVQILFLDPESGTYSLSKLQFYCWTFAALFGYVYLATSRLFVQGERWPDIPDGLPAVIALGAGTAVGAQIVQGTKGPKGAGTEQPSLGDFVTSGGVAAPERVQMLVWTIVGVLVFMYAVLQYGPEEIQALDPVPPGLLYMMGLSSLGYLGGKLARAAGPVINAISIVPAEPDQTLLSDTQPAVPDLTMAGHRAEQTAARLRVAGGTAAKPALDSLTAGINALKQATTLAGLRALEVTLAGETAKAESVAETTAAAVGTGEAPADASQAAQTAQGAAAALQDLSAAVTAALAAVPSTTGRREFNRVIELRGRNLSDQGLFSIDQIELPFRMLRPNADGKQQPDIVVREKNDPNMAVVLRLTIDANRLEEPDLRRYRAWFGAPSTQPKVFSIVNLDGQRADISFSVPPAAAQKSTEQAQQPGGAATAAIG